MDKATIKKIDDHTINVKGDFGSFTVNGTSFTATEAYFLRPSAHLYAGASMVMEMHIPGHSATGTTTTIVIFFEVQDDPEYDTFSYTVGFGTEDIKTMAVGDSKQNYDRIDMNLAVPQSQAGSEFLHYTGTSLWGKCENSMYLVSKITIIINAQQLYELADKPSNYEVNPVHIVVYDGVKPQKPESPQEDLEDTMGFDDVLYKNNYSPYPPTEGDKPPQDINQYPSPYFPYPDTWGWVGEPNYPNDPWYPDYVFPPEQSIVRPPSKEEQPPVATYETLYNDPVYPDQSPNWPFGYPIWPDLSYPVWPQNADFYPEMTDPYQDTNTPPKVNMNGSTPQPPFPFKTHPLFPYPYYTYLFPMTYYPHFPVEHWPDNVFDPKNYLGYPNFPNDQRPEMNPKTPQQPNDPKLRWPQNPYYSWPKVPGFKWPDSNRFEWPQDSTDPHWMWPSEPLKDPKWRRPSLPDHLPPVTGQRRPDSVVPAGSPVPTESDPSGLEPTDSAMTPRENIPDVEKPPQPRPGFTHPDPKQIVVLPHARPPFPVEDKDLPNVYRGVPNQPLGLLPTLAIPAWTKPNPKAYAVINRPTPKAPEGKKWIPYFYYPVPYRSKKTNRIGVAPQYILVDKSYNPPAVEPSSIPTYIVRPPAPGKPHPKKPDLILYEMPVLHKPVDPELKMKLRAIDDQKRSVQARLDKNKVIDKHNIDFLTKPPQTNTTFKMVNGKRVPGQPANSIYPPFTPSSPNATIVYDDKTGMPVGEILGYDNVCVKWDISVLVNRHFKQEFEWNHSDVELGKTGANRVCLEWKKVPRYRAIDQSRLDAWLKDQKGNKNADLLAKLKANPDANIPVPTVNVNKIRIEVPCDNQLDIVLNDRNMDSKTKEVTDTVGKKCHIWVNSQKEAQDYKQRNAELMKRHKESTIKQLAFMKMIPLTYDN